MSVLNPNPLSLSVPDPSFEAWLRTSGYLETLDHRTSQSQSLSSEAPPSPSLYPLFNRIRTIILLLLINPFAKLRPEDFSGETKNWTEGFMGSLEGYSWPAQGNQGRLRVYENLKRYARNYASLALLFFCCSLYQMPFALVGLVASLALWEGFKYCGDRWGLDQRPFVQQSLVRIAQCGTVLILFFSNVQMALFCALGVCYAVMILHASFRKLTPASKPARGRR